MNHKYIYNSHDTLQLRVVLLSLFFIWLFNTYILTLSLKVDLLESVFYLVLTIGYN